MTAPELVVERHGGVLLARLNRPEARNALTGSLMASIGTTLADAESDPDIRTVVLTGAGDRSFCAGMDLRAFSDGDGVASGNEPGTAGYRRFLAGELTVPVVGAANGTAIGGGFEILLACDVIVASEDAKFGLPEVKRGLFPAAGGTDLGTRIPLPIALELMLTGDPVDARRAAELGLVNTAVSPDSVLDTALELAGRIAANGPLGLTAIKELGRLALTDPAQAEQRKKHWQNTVFTSDDAKEGAAAFVEKRTPVWKGR